ncbi:glycosyltransferase family 2 protein [Streptomyces laurentii]|uniref:glycosyltransferase family 2 protein n=1 Tax=Streptomyces laurentii TaxID=39478 RepID=UPI00367AB874
MNVPRTPTVSLVIPVYNAMPYLELTLQSIEQQTIGLDAIEVVAVDDGSTDGSGDVLDTWAKANPGVMKVVHQEASGGPSRPRNVGLEHATGTYVFFVDGDDCLGPEALERLVAMAEKNGSDIVLAKLVGVRRKVPKAVFAKNVDRADLSQGHPYYTLMPFKLFRRALVEKHEIRFPEHMRIREDQYFVAQAYIHSEVISIVGDYDCYYVVRRADEGNITAGGIDFGVGLEQADEMVTLVTGLTEPGKLRDHLVGRHVKAEMVDRFDQRFVDADAEERQRLVDLARPYAQRWITPAIMARMPVHEKIVAHCLREGLTDEIAEVVAWQLAGRPGKTVVRGAKAYAAPPFPAADSPEYEELCEITGSVIGASPRRRVDKLAWRGTVLDLEGYAYIDQVDTRDLVTEVVLTQAGSGRRLAFPVEHVPSPHMTVSRGKETYDYGRACFRTSVDLGTADGGAALAQGDWHVSLRCTAGRLSAEGGLGSALGGKVSKRADEHAVTLPGTSSRKPHTVRVGPRDAELVIRLKQAPSALSAYAFSFGWKAARAVRKRIDWR